MILIVRILILIMFSVLFFAKPCSIAAAQNVGVIKQEIETTLGTRVSTDGGKVCFLNDGSFESRQRTNAIIWKERDNWSFILLRFDRPNEVDQSGVCGNFTFRCVIVKSPPPDELKNWCEGNNNFISPTPSTKSPRGSLNNPKLMKMLSSGKYLQAETKQVIFSENLMITHGEETDRNYYPVKVFDLDLHKEVLSSKRNYTIHRIDILTETIELNLGKELQAIYQNGVLSDEFELKIFGADGSIELLSPNEFQERLRLANQIFRIESKLPESQQDWEFYYDLAVMKFMGEEVDNEEFSELSQSPELFLRKE